MERDGRVAEIESTILNRGKIKAFAISPDGVRMALIRQVDGRTELGLARIVRGERIRLDGWLPLDVTRSTTPDLSLLRDLAWSDASSLAVLGGASGDAPLTVYRVSQDASSITAVGEPIAWDAVSLSVLLKSQTVVVLDSSGQTWRDGSTQWLTLLDEVSAVAGPGFGVHRMRTPAERRVRGCQTCPVGDRAVRERAWGWWSATADLLLGAGCPGCGSPWWGACPDCRAHLRAQPTRLTAPTPAPAGFPLTATAGPYDDVHRGLLGAHKEDQALMLTSLLGDRLAASVSELLTVRGVPVDEPVILVPVPSAAAAVRERGFDATGALARRAARRLSADRPVRTVEAAGAAPWAGRPVRSGRGRAGREPARWAAPAARLADGGSAPGRAGAGGRGRPGDHRREPHRGRPLPGRSRVRGARGGHRLSHCAQTVQLLRTAQDRRGAMVNHAGGD